MPIDYRNSRAYNIALLFFFVIASIVCVRVYITLFCKALKEELFIIELDCRRGRRGVELIDGLNMSFHSVGGWETQ